MKDKTYSAKLSGVLREFQRLVNSEDLSWPEGLSSKEVSFVYSCVMKANEIKNYQLTTDQARWGVIIINKAKATQRKQSRGVMM